MTDEEIIEWIDAFMDDPEHENIVPRYDNIIEDVRNGTAPSEDDDGLISDPIEAMLLGCLLSTSSRYWSLSWEKNYDAHDATENALIAAYNGGGVTGVIDWVKENRPDWNWMNCRDCEQSVPVWETETGGLLCAVCWTELSVSNVGHDDDGDPFPEEEDEDY